MNIILKKNPSAYLHLALKREELIKKVHEKNRKTALLTRFSG